MHIGNSESGVIHVTIGWPSASHDVRYFTQSLRHKSTTVPRYIAHSLFVPFQLGKSGQ